MEYGGYLATIGGCRGCHGLALAGDANPDAPDITVGRLASWTEEDFFRALREGLRPDGSAIDPEKMPWVTERPMTDDEIRAVWTVHAVAAGRGRRKRRTLFRHGDTAGRSRATRAISLPTVRVAPRMTIAAADHHQREQQDGPVQPELVRQHADQRQRDRVAGEVDEEQVGARPPSR